MIDLTVQRWFGAPNSGFKRSSRGPPYAAGGPTRPTLMEWNRGEKGTNVISWLETVASRGSRFRPKTGTLLGTPRVTSVAPSRSGWGSTGGWAGVGWWRNRGQRLGGRGGQRARAARYGGLRSISSGAVWLNAVCRFSSSSLSSKVRFGRYFPFSCNFSHPK